MAEALDGPGMATSLNDAQNMVTPMFGAGDPSTTNTRYHNQQAAAYNAIILPLLAFVMSRGGSALGPPGIFSRPGSATRL